VSLDEELSRVLPVIEDLRKETDVCISIDTTKSEVANQALEMGASIINDVSAMEFDKKMIDIALKFDCPIVLMHMKGIPKNMQENPHYSSLISEIITYLNARIDFVLSKGIDRKKIIIDPGIGFGKSVENNFEIINNLNQFVDLGYPVMLGASRKSFIGITLDVPEDKRVEGSLAANIIGFQKGVSVFRVHDVDQTRKALTITKKIFNSDHLIN
jgi:dihydropteroate synthase